MIKKTAKRTTDRRGRPPKITRKAIVAVALKAKGNLSHASVAKALKVTPQALYNHVGSLSDIIKLVANELSEQFPLPVDRGQNWYEWAYESATGLRGYYEKIPGFSDSHFLQLDHMSGGLLRYERSIEIALRTGLDMRSAFWATKLVMDFTYSFVLEEKKRTSSVKHPPLLKQRAATVRHFIGEILDGATGFPMFGAGFKQGQEAGTQARFDYQLRCVIEGVAYRHGHQKKLPLHARA